MDPGVDTLSHSHIAVQHLMKQMESWQPGRRSREARPDWLTGLIEDMSELFEPLTGVARVGFDCRREEEHWVVRMYLGASELVGGSLDGQVRPMSFDFDLQKLTARFQAIEEFSWSVFPDDAEDVEEPQAYITLTGRVDAENTIRLHFFAVPPADVGPGMRLFPDGRFEPT